MPIYDTPKWKSHKGPQNAHYFRKPKITFLVQYVYHLIYTRKGILFAKRLKINETFESGNLLISFIFWFLLTCNGFFTYPILQYHNFEFTVVVNSLYKYPALRNHF